MMIDEPEDHLLDEVYTHELFQFHYPGYWTIEEQQDEEGLTVTVFTENSCFWMLSFTEDQQDPDDVIDAAVEAFLEEYKQIDVYSRENSEAGWSKQEIEFECSDYIAVAMLQAVQFPGSTFLLLMQGQDQEFEEVRQTFDAITNSLRKKEETTR